MDKAKGKLIIMSAPSGSGKTTLVKRLLEEGLPLEFSISATSRLPRGQEQEGKDYYFLSSEVFGQKVQEGAFVEWEEVYEGVCYGTLKSEMARIWNKGHHVIFDVDVVGGLNLKKIFGQDALAIFIQAPDMQTLEQRLRNRSTDDEASIQKRLGKAAYEMGFAKDFDVVIVNDKLDDAYKELSSMVKDFIC